MASIIETLKKGIAAGLLVATFAGSQIYAQEMEAEGTGFRARATARWRGLSERQKMVAKVAAAAAAAAATAAVVETGALAGRGYYMRRQALKGLPATATAAEKAAAEKIGMREAWEEQKAWVKERPAAIKKTYKKYAPKWAGGEEAPVAP